MIEHPVLSAAKLSPGDCVLEIGFRHVKGMRALAKTVGCQGHVTGIDIDPKHVTQANIELGQGPRANIHTVDGSILDLPFPDGAFDAVFCLGVLHEVRDVNRAVSEMARVLRSSGRAVIADFQRFSRWLFGLYRIHVRLQGKTTLDVHPGFTVQGMADCLRMHGLCNVSCETRPEPWRMGFIRCESFLLVARKQPRSAQTQTA